MHVSGRQEETQMDAGRMCEQILYDNYVLIMYFFICVAEQTEPLSKEEKYDVPGSPRCQRHRRNQPE